MLSLPNGPPHSEKTIELSDPNFEDAAKIRTCLTLVTSLGLDFDLKNGKSVGCLLWKDPLLKVMSFIVKYDFAGALTLLKMAGTQAYVDGKFKYRLDAFAFGALTGNVGLCKTVVSTDEVPWGNSTGSAFGFSPGSKLLSAMPPNVVMAIRPQIKFAILRAGNHAEPGTHKFGKYFEAILTAVLTANGEFLHDFAANSRRGPSTHRRLSFFSHR